MSLTICIPLDRVLAMDGAVLVELVRLESATRGVAGAKLGAGVVIWRRALGGGRRDGETAGLVPERARAIVRLVNPARPKRAVRPDRSDDVGDGGAGGIRSARSASPPISLGSGASSRDSGSLANSDSEVGVGGS